MPIFIATSSGSIEECDAPYIDSIVESKRTLNPWDLVEETHKSNGAWDRIYRDGLGNHCVIPTELIKVVG